tara:strand:- start:112 stop:393 length:282 start_codon:yes stop_codon:yes gene_type:complete
MSHYDEQREEHHAGMVYEINHGGVKTSSVNSPPHYNSHPSGIECRRITDHMNFNLGNALKYIWRCDLKKDAIEDLEKAKWYIDSELQKRRKGR